MIRALINGLDALLTHPMRTVLSTLGVIIGVASIVAILALGDGLETFSREQIERTTDLQIISVAPRTTDRIDGILVRRDSIVQFTRSDLQDLRERLGPDVRAYRLLTGSALARPPDSTRDVGLLLRAVDPGALDDEARPILHGSRAAWRTGADPVPAILTRATAEVFFAGRVEDAPGQELEVGGRRILVAAVLEGSTSDRPLEAFLPLDAATQSWLGRPDLVPTIMVRAGRIEGIEAAAAATNAWVDDRFPGDDVQVASHRARVRQASQALSVFKLGLAAIAGISLLVGGIGIMNILLASVTERTREIGIRKSIGARSMDVRRQFLAESVAISGIGSLLGVLLGMGGAVGVTAVIRMATDAAVYATFRWESILIAVGAAVIVGLVFGTYPARRAARLSPIDAIRHD